MKQFYDCRVITLASSVDNSDLPTRGIVVTTNTNATNIGTMLHAYKSGDFYVSAKVKSGETLINGLTQIDGSYPYDIDITGGAGTIEWNLEKTQMFVGGGCRTKDLVSPLVLMTAQVYLGGGLKGDIADMFVPELITGDFGSTSLYGDISSLSYLIKARNLKFDGSAVNGSLESLAQGLIDNGRLDSTGTLVVTCNGIITLNSVAVAANTSKTITFSGGSYSIA